MSDVGILPGRMPSLVRGKRGTIRVTKVTDARHLSGRGVFVEVEDNCVHQYSNTHNQ